MNDILRHTTQFNKAVQAIKATYMRNWRKSHQTYYRDFYNRLFDQLRLKYGNKCACCERTDNLQFAHIKDTALKGLGRGKKTRYYDIIKHPDSYVLMNKYCHYGFDKISPELKIEWLQKHGVKICKKL